MANEYRLIMEHPGIDGTCVARSEKQAAIYARTGWVPAPVPAADEVAEVDEGEPLGALTAPDADDDAPVAPAVADPPTTPIQPED